MFILAVVHELLNNPFSYDTDTCASMLNYLRFEVIAFDKSAVDSVNLIL